MAEKYTGSACTGAFGLIGAALLALAFAACSGVPSSPEGVAKKLLRAHGGAEKATRLRSYAAKGFIKDMSSDLIARNFALDVYRKGDLYKHLIANAPGGKLADVIVLYFDGTTSREWLKGRGVHEVPTMELGLLKYRFPDCIQWAQTAAGELLPVAKQDSVVRVRYTDGPNVVTLAVDRTTWLLSGVEVRSSTDTVAAFAERYDHYTDLAGIPFPQEFKATFRGAPYYEYLLSVIDLEANLPDSLFGVTSEDTIGVTGGAAQPQEPSQR